MNNWNSNNLIRLKLSRINRTIKYLTNNIKIPEISVFFFQLLFTERHACHNILFFFGMSTIWPSMLEL